MATPSATYPITAAQVGTYFVHQYYNLLQTQPEYVHQFYTDASTMLRIDGTTVESASAMMQIHALVMSLNYTLVEIKTAHSLDSWNGGIMAMASGSIQLKDNSRKKFVQTFFLAPQEKGYFVLNDFFHFIDDEPAHHPSVLYDQSIPGHAYPVPVPTLLTEVQNHGPEIEAHVNDEENGSAEKDHFSEQKLSHNEESKIKDEDKPADHATESIQKPAPATQQPASPSLPEPQKLSSPSLSEPQKLSSPSLPEPQKLSYASILRITKGQPVPSQPSRPTNENSQHGQERHQLPPSTTRQSSPPIKEGTEDLINAENEGDIKSVYVRNLPSDVSVHDVEQLFKMFGNLKPDGVVIRRREDVAACFAFVEFEDIEGVQNAIKASAMEIGGRQVVIEERRAKNSFASRGGKRFKGRGNYQTDGPRVRTGNRYGREPNERDYRPRGNGVYRQVHRHEHGFSSNQPQTNGQRPLE